MLESWIIPVVICVALVVIIGLLFRKAKRGNGEFDERQALLRAASYKHAFFTVMILSALYAFIVSVTDISFMADGVAAVIIVLIGIGVFAVSCVLRGAFFTVNQRPGSYLLLAGLCVVADGIGGIMNLVNGECVKDGLLTMSCLPLVVGVVFLAVFLAIVWKAYLKKEADEE